MRKYLTLPNFIALLTFVCSGLFWVFTINGIPKIVNNHETRITTLEKDTIDSKARQELMLQAIYETRADVKQLMLRNNNIK